MAGAGVDADNVLDLAARTGVTQFHASARASRSPFAQRGHNAPQGLSSTHFQTDPAMVRALKNRLQD
jgi:copper homeostasis protein